MCAERRLAEIRGVPEPVRRKAPGWRCEGCQEAPKKLEGKKEEKKRRKKKKLSAERRRRSPKRMSAERRRSPRSSMLCVICVFVCVCTELMTVAPSQGPKFTGNVVTFAGYPALGQGVRDCCRWTPATCTTSLKSKVSAHHCSGSGCRVPGVGQQNQARALEKPRHKSRIGIEILFLKPFILHCLEKVPCAG